MNHNLKPFLRGHFHQAAFFMALGACLILVFRSHHLGPSLVYSLSLVTLFGVSALYHRINWRPRARMIMRRLDHASIFFLIAGTMTPLCLLALPPESGKKLLITAWTAAGIGMALSIFFTKKPKWLNALLCAGAAVVGVPYFSDMISRLGPANLWLVISGTLAYGVGALSYAFKRPNFFPRVFGYHELFHVMVIVGAANHFIVIHSLV